MADSLAEKNPAQTVPPVQSEQNQLAAQSAKNEPTMQTEPTGESNNPRNKQ